MAKFYGDIPCVKLDGVIHITTSATSCLCGKSWVYGVKGRNDSASVNIIWRELDAVACDKCKRLFIQ